MERFITLATVYSILYWLVFYGVRLADDYQVLTTGTVPSVEIAVRDVIRGTIYDFSEFLALMILIFTTLASLYCDYYLVQAALHKPVSNSAAAPPLNKYVAPITRTKSTEFLAKQIQRKNSGFIERLL